MSPLPIRPDLQQAFRGLWDWVARPGCWWSGEQRVALVSEARAALGCKLCAERKQALSPSMAQGEHDRVNDALPPVAVDAVHRLVTDATRLSSQWLAQAEADGLSDGHYVELLGVVVHSLSVDRFHRALGLPLEPLPTAESGEPSGYRPAGARPGVGWVAMIPGSRTGSEEADIYDGPSAPNVIRAMSLVPDCVRQLKSLSAASYLPIELLVDPGADTGRALDRAQIELVAGRVSALNECFY